MINTTNPFDACSQQYGRFRPDYPEELIDYVQSICKVSNPLYLDVGAGTGKASAPFAARGLTIVSLEPSFAMAEQGLQSYPKLRYVCSKAEQLPVCSESVDVIVCGQAFHWFDADSALEEFARVLKQDSHVCLFWNTRDLEFPQVRLFDGLIRKWNPGHDTGYRDRDWTKLIDRNTHFRFLGQHRFRLVTPMNIDDWIGLSRSISYVQSMGAENLAGFESDLRAGLMKMDSIACPYNTDLWVAQKSA